MNHLNIAPKEINSSFEQTALPANEIASLSAISEALNAPQAMLVDSEGNSIPIPPEVHSLLIRVVEAMQAGRAIHLTPIATTLTTGEAASFLGISRPTLVKLLEEGEIDYTKPNRHRYVLLTDLIEYKQKMKKKTRVILDSLSEDALSDSLYDVSAERVQDAIRKVRKG